MNLTKGEKMGMTNISRKKLTKIYKRKKIIKNSHFFFNKFIFYFVSVRFNLYFIAHFNVKWGKFY